MQLKIIVNIQWSKLTQLNTDALEARQGKKGTPTGKLQVTTITSNLHACAWKNNFKANSKGNISQMYCLCASEYNAFVIIWQKWMCS